MRMKPVDRVRCLTAALFGIGAFFFALLAASNPMGRNRAGRCPSAFSA